MRLRTQRKRISAEGRAGPLSWAPENIALSVPALLCPNLDFPFITSLLLLSRIVRESQVDLEGMVFVAELKSSQNKRSVTRNAGTAIFSSYSLERLGTVSVRCLLRFPGILLGSKVVSGT